VRDYSATYIFPCGKLTVDAIRKINLCWKRWTKKKEEGDREKGKRGQSAICGSGTKRIKSE